MFEILYNIFIMPVESIVEFIFYFMNNIFPDKPAVSIMFVSLVINLLILPLYKRADDMQEQEREKVKSMERWLKHIKKTFKGDERYMMQTAYYRIEGYKPFYAITGSLSLLFQIPFFIAAYHFLSNLDILDGVGFLMISDLGAPDKILRIGGLSLNLLPVLMTVINILSGVIYTKGFKAKDKIQLYAMAVLFLIVLYQSPSGLVLYWTCNNLFSLLKNVFFKIVKRKRLAINVISALFGTLLFVFLLISGRLTVRRQLFLFALVAMASYIPILLSIADKYAAGIVGRFKDALSLKKDEKKKLNVIFILASVFVTVFLGFNIPAQLILSSPVEFGTLVKNTPLSLVGYSFSFYVGFVLLWIGVFYAISTDSVKKFFAYGMWLFAGVSVLDYYVFFGKFGTMDCHLKFIEAPVYNDLQKLINLLVVVAVSAVLIFVLKKFPEISKYVLIALIATAVIPGCVSIYKTHKTLKDEGYYVAKKDSTIVPTVPVSGDGQNVMVFILDRAISEYVPYVFMERPDIAEEFEDFVYYPNTISYGGCTNFAMPSLLGGYEYTPDEMNKRDDVLLEDKNNEAILLMPSLFSDNGYEVSFLDPPYANYKELPDVSVFDGYDNVTGYVTRNKYADYAYHDENELVAQKKHTVFYSLFRTAPVLLQNSIYDNGNYLGKPSEGDMGFKDCAESYALLDNLDTYTYVENEGKNELLILYSLMTHSPTYLEMPNYELGNNLTAFPFDKEYEDSFVYEGKKLKMDNYDNVMLYHVNVASFRLLGEYFEFLKKEGAYDNTRIIIVSDHGWPVNQMEGSQLDEETYIETFNPLFMVKDFADNPISEKENIRHSDEANLNICDDFMTNADVSLLAMEGIIENPVNPFTGNEINDDIKKNQDQKITTSRLYSVHDNNGTVFDTSDFPWMTFTPGDVKDRDNWHILYEQE